MTATVVTPTRGDARFYAVAGALVAAGLFHLAVQLVDGGAWTGPVSWRKPITFGLSFGVTLATVTWVSGYLPLTRRRRRLLLSVFAAACCLEVAVITVQAWRGVPSHFNTTTPVNAAFAFSAAAGGAVLVCTTAVLASAWLRLQPWVPPSMRLGLRVGMASFAGALLVGVLMIARGVTAARTGSLDDAYAAAGPLKPLHGALMHGIFVLPALAAATARLDWPERRRVRVVAAACSGYLMTVAAVVAYVIAG
jgi:hypothetical protein